MNKKIVNYNSNNIINVPNKKENKSNIVLKYFYHKKTSPFLQNRLIKGENNIFIPIDNNNNTNYNSEFRTSIISDYRKNIKQVNNSNTKKIFKLQRRFSLVPYDKSSNSYNMKSLIKRSQNINLNDDQNLPTILKEYSSNTQKSIKINSPLELKGFKKEIENLKNKFNDCTIRANSYRHNDTKIQISSKNIKKIDNKGLFITPYTSKRKYNKLNTVLTVNRKYNITNILKKTITSKENGEENGYKRKEQSELKYNKIINNHVLKLFKTSDNKSNIIQNIKKKIKEKISNIKNNNTIKKFAIMEYLNKFSPKDYINYIEEKNSKIIKEYSKDIKNKLLNKTYNYIENIIFKKAYILKKNDVFEKILEKNKHLLKKYKKNYIELRVDEIAFKNNIKHKPTIQNLHKDSIKILKNIPLNTYIKLNIIKHVLTKSEKDENLYFINLIKHFLYSGNKRFKIKYPFIKGYEDIYSSTTKKVSSINKFIEYNNRKMHFLYFSAKFQLIDCETLLRSYESKQQDIINKKKAKIIQMEISEENNDKYFDDDTDSFPIDNKNKIWQKGQRKTILFKFSSSSKLMNLNLTKSIINLRGNNLEDLKLNLNMINNNYKNKVMDFSYSSDTDDYDISSNNYGNNYRNNNTINAYKNNRLMIDTTRSIEEDNKEIHLRYKKLLLEHFLICVEFSEYDKLYHFLKKSSRYMNLNCTFENDETLLHLGVKNSVPLYIMKYLITHGVNINSQNSDGDTALHLAVKNHKYKVIDLLIKMGASEYIYNNKQKNCWECL